MRTSLARMVSWHGRLASLQGELEVAGGAYPSKLENLVRYAAEEAGAEIARLKQPAVPDESEMCDA